MATQKYKKNDIKFFCELCDYETCYKNNYDKHVITAKHQKRYFSNSLATLKLPKVENISVKTVIKFIRIELDYGDIINFVNRRKHQTRIV